MLSYNQVDQIPADVKIAIIDTLDRIQNKHDELEAKYQNIINENQMLRKANQNCQTSTIFVPSPQSQIAQQIPSIPVTSTPSLIPVAVPISTPSTKPTLVITPIASATTTGSVKTLVNSNDYVRGSGDGYGDGKANKPKSSNKATESADYNTGYEDGYSSGLAEYESTKSSTQSIFGKATSYIPSVFSTSLASYVPQSVTKSLSSIPQPKKEMQNVQIVGLEAGIKDALDGKVKTDTLTGIFDADYVDNYRIGYNKGYVMGFARKAQSDAVEKELALQRIQKNKIEEEKQKKQYEEEKKQAIQYLTNDDYQRGLADGQANGLLEGQTNVERTIANSGSDMYKKGYENGSTIGYAKGLKMRTKNRWFW
jgi:flagellar biosynthesis/type III secretory pathway protein FliH